MHIFNRAGELERIPRIVAVGLNQRVRARLVALMDQTGVSQSGLARATGYRQPVINRFFTGQMKYPPLDFLDAMARVFEYTLADLLHQELPPPTLTPVERDVLATWRTLDAGDRGAFGRLMLRKNAGRSAGRGGTRRGPRA